MMEWKHPTEDEMMEMMEDIKKYLVQPSGEKFSERDEAFFTAGFRCGISSFLRREAMRQLFTQGTKAN